MSEFGKTFDVSALNDSTFNLRENLLEHKVLIFHNTNYDINQYYDLMKVLLKDDNILSMDDDYKYGHLIKLQNSKAGEYAYYARWQIDSCWDIEVADICSLNVLNAEQDATSMIWVDLEKVRSLLNKETFDFIIKHKATGWNILNPRDLHSRQDTPGYQHPALRVHPETNRESVFYSGPSTIGKDNDVWQKYLKYLLEFFQDSNNLFTIKLSQGDIIIWDNRCTAYTFSGHDNAVMQKALIYGSIPVWS
jgi:alpha-ketoglutarate-dependent taurine dioxygenase